MRNSIHELSNAGDDFLMADGFDQNGHLWPRLQQARVGMASVKEEGHLMM
jgi:hypothetical protein